MANWDNLSTKIVQEEIMGSYERGFWDGYNSDLQQLPGCYYKPVYLLKPYERGVFLGREVRLTERATNAND